jgi:pimeloyl-ACP methyl ester carboxylesterase
MIEGLSQTHEVVAFDNRGAGRTEKLDDPYSIEMMAEDAAGLVRVLGVHPDDYSCMHNRGITHYIS